MTALAVAGILGGGFADSLGQLARSPWALVIAVTLAMVSGSLLLRLRQARRMPLLALPPGVPCPCCTTRPMESDDCTCREDCGVTWCQAADPPGHIEGCGPGRNMLAYPSLACPACDWTAGRMEVGDDTLAMLAQHREHDDDTFLADGLTAELERLLKGDGRDG